MTTDAPVPLDYLHRHEAANEPVTLHEGPVLLRHSRGEARGAGKLALCWVPSTRVRLEFDLQSGEEPDVGGRVMADVAGGSADVLIYSKQVEVTDTVSARGPGNVSVLETGCGAALTAINFQVVNFADFFTPGASRTGFGFPPHVAELEGGGWRVRISAVEKSSALRKSLDETGGYGFTHVGCLDRNDGAAFAAKEGETILAALERFLSFARGAACSLPIRWGIDAKGGVVWQRWGSPIVDPWKRPHSWFDEHHGSLLASVFPAFLDAYLDADLGEPLKLAVHWFQKCNTRAGGMEGAIILGLTALDLLGAVVVVDRAGVMTAGKYDALTAAAKLAQLLDVLKVPPGVPAHLAELGAFAAGNGWGEAAETLAEIRHGYVHPNRRRRAVVLRAPNVATYQAWQLSLWYQELALLYVLRHDGEYRNRLTAQWVGEVERVPWA